MKQCDSDFCIYHMIQFFAGIMGLLLLDRDLLWDQTICGDHHIIICQPEGQICVISKQPEDRDIYISE